MQEKLLSNQQKLNDINYNYNKIEENICNAALATKFTIIYVTGTLLWYAFGMCR